MSSFSSTLNFQVQHKVANDVKVIYSRPNNNREIYLRYEEAWSITRDTILTTAAANIPVKRAVRRPWLTTETMDIIDQKKDARLKGNHDEWKRL